MRELANSIIINGTTLSSSSSIHSSHNHGFKFLEIMAPIVAAII